MSNGKPQQDGLLAWVGMGVVCFLVMGALLWLVASHKIVYYSAPVLDFFAYPWRLLPQSTAGTKVSDLNVYYEISRRAARHMDFGSWVSYVNLALRPLSILFVGVAVYLFRKQHRSIKEKRLTQRLTPTQLAMNMMRVFTDIAPVVSIQEKLVSNSLKKWARQVFPEELIRKARYQGKSVLVNDLRRGCLMVDEARLKGYFQETKAWKHNEITLMHSRHLGRQIVDILQDGKTKGLVFPDRLSNAGKAIYAILAPYAFGASKGKIESKTVSDALNMSSFGSPEGMANLSIKEVSDSFDKWREHPLARRLAKIHHWENTFLWSLLEYARKSGKIGTWNFIWLKPTNRVLFYALNSAGRKTPHSEPSLAFSQFQYEERVARAGRLPLTKNGKHVIFSPKVVEALQEEWELWLAGDEDTENWWKSGTANDWEANSGLMQALSEMKAPPVPSNAI